VCWAERRALVGPVAIAHPRVGVLGGQAHAPWARGGDGERGAGLLHTAGVGAGLVGAVEAARVGRGGCAQQAVEEEDEFLEALSALHRRPRGLAEDRGVPTLSTSAQANREAP